MTNIILVSRLYGNFVFNAIAIKLFDDIADLIRLLSLSSFGALTLLVRFLLDNPFNISGDGLN